MKPLLLIRTDASARIGMGHFMRCLSLAQGWQRAGGAALFALAASAPSLQKRLNRENFSFEPISATPGSAGDAAQTISLAIKHGAVWLVVDGYQFDADFQRRIKAAGLRLLFLDDYGHAGSYCADLVLNQNLGANAETYQNRNANTRLLLSTSYVLLGQKFLTHRNWNREIAPIARKVLVTLGGGDPDNVTGKVIDALRELDVEARIVIGGANPHREALQLSFEFPPSTGAQPTKERGADARFELLMDVAHMPELMVWADVAIAAGGTTAWELAFMGLPSLVVALADNQRENVRHLDATGASVNLGWHADVPPAALTATLRELLSDQPRRAEMSRRGHALVDGLGADRVVTRLQAARLGLRRAKSEDCRQLWEWANDPQVRGSAFSSNQIPWNDHVRWFEQKLNAPRSLILIGSDESGESAGQVRLDCNERWEAEVDVSVDARLRGAGFGSALIRRAADEAFSAMPIQTVHAHVKPGNAASIRAFERAGFHYAGKIAVREEQAVHLTLSRDDD